ncbi:RNA 2',3'-cyclic phosphodiesterase [Bordetella pseudohinzii]|nr:RNA 2',3'-cyclic phosphodiesterase [Bordetella pseudohinzii]ANY17789.1 2'-5' RNA ligase [Bordetella pseudohinzii]
MAIPSYAGSARLFFALWPSAALAGQLAAWARHAQPYCGGRIMRADTLHITLAFLGPASPARTRQLIDYTRQSRIAPGEIRIARYGSFKRPRIIWAGPEGRHEALAALHEQIWRDIAPLGWIQEEPDFTPHVTLLRKASGFEPPDPPGALDWPYAHFCLMASEPGGQSRYRELARSR